MAQKRMISQKIVDTDLFLKMPISARLLYYDLNIRADDDGFVDAPIKIMKMVGCSEDDLKVLVAKGFIIPFDSGICVIRHWWMHNTIRRDRYNGTIHIDEKNQLSISNKTYDFTGQNENGNQMATKWQPNGNPDKISSNSNIYIEVDNQGKNIYEIIEEEFGRTISPMEYEIINTWDYPLEILKIAIKEASTSNNKAIKYLDKIIYNWKKDNLKTVEEVNEYIKNFHKKKSKNRNVIESDEENSYERF